MKTFKLTSGLGDCLIAGASLQKLNRPVNFITNPLLEPVFRHHPTIKFFSYGKHDFEFKWVSQIKDKNLYALHTMQRFSSQIGFYIDPTEVLNIYNENGQQILNKNKWTIVINQYSAEGERRCIPAKYINMIEEIIDGDYKIELVGKNDHPYRHNSITDISKIMDSLANCKLFIGPISFCYHLAACYRTPSVLFTSYMPPHKFSHFTNTTHITANAQCSFMCEQNNVRCLPDCMAYSYNDEEIYNILHRKIREYT